MRPVFLEAIKKFEGFTGQAEWDYKQFTNGYGTKARHPGEIIDRYEAARRFDLEIREAAARVDKFAPTLDEGSKAALTSLTFNAGPGWMKSGLGVAISQGDLFKAQAIFREYSKAGGRTLAGLVARREVEVQWFGQRSSPEVSIASQGATRKSDLDFKSRPVNPPAESPVVAASGVLNEQAGTQLSELALYAPQTTRTGSELVTADSIYNNIQLRLVLSRLHRHVLETIDEKKNQVTHSGRSES